MAASDRRWPRRVAVLSVLALVLLAVGYYTVSGFLAYRDLTATRTALLAARDIGSTAPAQAQQSLQDASTSAEAAANRLDGPLWTALAAVPLIGDTPDAARQVTTGLNQTLQALQPLVDSLDLLSPTALVTEGRINIDAIEQAVPAAQQALPGLATAQNTLADVPTGGAVLPQISDAATELQQQVAELQGTLTTVDTIGPIAAPLLGANGQKRYFVALLNPNEARGTGGFLGNYAILTASDGAITVGDIGSNTDLPTLESLPAELDKQFRYRYRDDPTLIGNMNISPHFPDTARIWLAAWEQLTGETLDGAIAMDTVTLGRLVAATDMPVNLPDGGTMSGSELDDFANIGIYEKFPEVGEVPARKAYQEAVSLSALQTVIAMPRPLAMGEALGQGLQDNRVVVWSADPEVEQVLNDAGVSGTLVVPDGHQVQAVVLNTSGSKLDAYLDRSVRYDVGRCPTENGRVESSVTVSLRSDVPLGERPPAYMVGEAETTPTGPVNTAILQLHLPNGARVQNATINGKSPGLLEFREQNRPAVLVGVDLPPRQRQEVVFTFTEPASDGPAEVTVQPLFREQQTVVADVGC